MTPIVYVIGWKSQSNVDKLAATLPEGTTGVLISNGPEPLQAPEGWEHISGHGPRYFTSGVNRALFHFYWQIFPRSPRAFPVVCNDDLTIEPGCLEALAVEIGRGAGLAAPVQAAPNSPDLITLAATGPAWPAGRHQGCHRLALPEVESIALRWLNFACVAVNPEMIFEVGVLDKNLRHWFSDSDYSIRARDAGWPVVIVPSAIVQHAEHFSQKQENAEAMQMIFQEDQAAFYRKWGGQIIKEMS